jgi:hypothetical protein
MVSSVIRNAAYVLHILSSLAWAALPVLELLQDTGLAEHGSVQMWMMIFLLGFGLPAVIVMLVAVVVSFLVRPPDFALWLMATLLVTLCAVFMFAAERKILLEVLTGAYVLAALGFGIRRFVNALAWRAKSN